MGILTVTIERVMNLKDKDGIGRSDPYVKLELKKERLGFDKKFGKYVTSKKDGCNPEFMETFTWEDVEDLNDMVLTVKVMDSDIGLDDSLGYCEVKLENESLSSSPKAIIGVVDPKRFRIFAEEATIHMQVAFEG